MSRESAEFYDNIYLASCERYGEPHEFLIQVISKLNIGGRALDLGAGQGRYAIRLARDLGYFVVAVDESEIGSDQIYMQAQDQNLPIKICIHDISKTRIIAEYDLIVCTFVLHHIRKEKSLEIIQNMQSHTRPGGANVIAGFMPVDEFYGVPSSHDTGYFAHSELEMLYWNWRIHYYCEKQTETFDGTPNPAAFLVAQKPV